MRAVAAILCVAYAAAADGIDVQVTVEPPIFPFHRQPLFTIVATAPADSEIEISEMDGRFGGLNVYAGPAVTSESLEDGRKRVTHTYVLDADRAGIYPVGAVEVKVDGGETISVSAPGIVARTLTPQEKAEVERFAPAADPIDLPAAFYQQWQFWAACATLALLAACISAILYSRRRTPKGFQRIQPPWEVALGRLKSLEERRLPESGKIQPYYVELSAILRHYIEDRFHIHAPERTTPEFLAEASGRGVFTEDQQQLLSRFLRHSDRVKFAQHRPTTEEMELSFSEVRRFVMETTPSLPPAQERAA